MQNDISRPNDREYRWHFYCNAHIPFNLALLFLFLHIGICLRSSLIQGGAGGGKCARGRNRGRLEETMLKPLQMVWSRGRRSIKVLSPHCLVPRSPENMIMRAILKMDHG